mgnify:CR=1 FL=1
MRNVVIVGLVLLAIWWAVENPSTARGLLDWMSYCVQQGTDTVTD